MPKKARTWKKKKSFLEKHLWYVSVFRELAVSEEESNYVSCLRDAQWKSCWSLAMLGKMSNWPAAFSPNLGSSSWGLRGFFPPLQPQTKSHNPSWNLFFPSLPAALKDITRERRTTRAFISSLQYDKEINVINTATAECSVPSKRRVDLPVTAGERLDIIDVTEGNAVICRNSEGRCKFAESLWHGWSLCNAVLRGNRLHKQRCVICA